jgi:predicted acyl esterase
MWLHVHKPNALTVFLLVLLLTTCITAQTPEASGSSNYDIAAFPNIMVPMRDDVRLATNIYRPAENGKVVEGKFPVILERTPYGKDNDVYYANYWVKQGYVVILQDGRGRFNSEVSGDFSATILTTATTLPSGLAPSPGPIVPLGP